MREQSCVPDEILGVDMNGAIMTSFTPDTMGGIGTENLGGCTAVAGSARLPDGTLLAYISHMDPITDRLNRFGANGMSARGAAPSDRALVGFLFAATRRGAQDIKVVLAYDDNAVHRPDYGDHTKHYDEWHFLDQLKNTLKYQGAVAKVHTIPYVGGTGSSLVVIKDKHGTRFEWDGTPVDFKGDSSTLA